ncbi:NAD(P)H-binding protein [Nonomuraea sp. NPDC050790]|uniref:NAD(P)H-binding protein n=1 Tax=Nonomuraea sp. NPDC050790 TaxID=3364371 RepID=UPI00379E5094
MTILVTGATGTVGRQIVAQLVERGERVRALTRDPSRADFPAGVEVAAGDLLVAETLAPALDGVTALHLITVGGEGLELLPNGKEIVELAAKAGVERVSVLGSWEEGSVEAALRESTMAWTLLRCMEFMANAFDWQEEARTEGVVRVFGNQPGAVVHEADIAAVAVAALTSPGHEGRVYLLSGPEVTTPEERVRLLAEASGHDIRFEPLTEAQLRERMAAEGADESLIEFAIMLGTTPPEEGRTILPTVQEVTGHPGRTFAQWAQEHASAFRP